MTNSHLPQFFERLKVTPAISSFDDVAKELTFSPVPSDKIISRVNELTELRSLIDIAIQSYMVQAKEGLVGGREIAGFKLVAGRKTRTINNKLKCVEVLGRYGLEPEQLYTQELLGLPAIESLLKEGGMDKEEIQGVLGNFVTTTVSDPSVKIA